MRLFWVDASVPILGALGQELLLAVATEWLVWFSLAFFDMGYQQMTEIWQIDVYKEAVAMSN